MFFEFKYPFSKNIYRCWCAINTTMISTSLLERYDALENALKSRKRFLSQDQCLLLISVYFWRSKRDVATTKARNLFKVFSNQEKVLTGNLYLLTQ